MKNFRSTNPLMPRVHATPEQLWWTDSAWDENTAEYLTSEARKAEDIPAFLTELTDTLIPSARVNLPGFLPTGEWMFSYLSQFGLELFGDMEEGKNVTPYGTLHYPHFSEWLKYPHLSDPIRLYAYLNEAKWIEAEPAMRLLLLTASLTEDDLSFLLGDPSEGESETPKVRYSRAQIIAESAASLTVADKLFDILQNAAAIYDGFMPRRDLTCLMANHSFADSPRFDEVLEEIDRWRDEPRLSGVGFGEEVNLFLRAAVNPAVNDSTLKYLYSLTSREREVASAVVEHLKTVTNLPEDEQEAKTKILEATVRKVSSRLTAENQGQNVYANLVYLAGFISLHPNWVPFESQTPERAQLRQGLPRGLHGTLADIPQSPVMYEATHKAASMDGKWLMRAMTPHVIPFSPHLRGYAKMAIFGAGERKASEVCSFAFAIGSLLAELDDVKHQLGDAGDQVPEEWLLELLG